MSYSISGKALEELQKATKENPSAIFTKKEVKSLWQYIKDSCQVDAHQTYFCFENAGQVYEVDIIGDSLSIYKHDWKPS